MTERLTDAELERLATVCADASPGPWEWWTSCSFRRLTGADGKDGGVLRAVVYRDGQPGVEVREEDAALIVAAREHLHRLLAEVKERREAERATPPPPPTP